MRRPLALLPCLCLAAAAQTVTYEDGLVLSVRGVRVDDGGTTLTVRVQNGSPEAVELALAPREDIWFRPMLVNEQGRQAFAQPPGGNRTLKVAAGGEANFTLRFAGMRGEAFNLSFNAPKNVAVIGSLPSWEVPGIVASAPRVSPASAPLRLRARTGDGANVSVSRIAVDGQGIGLDVKIDVPASAKRGFEVARVNQACLTTDRRLTLIDARGRRYFPDYSRGLLAEDRLLTVYARGQKSGTLYFRPPPLPGAGTLKLVVNDCNRNDTVYPGSVLDLPGIPVPK